MMSTVRHINTSAMSIRKKKWEYLPYVGRQMNFLTVGVVGYGRLGKISSNIAISILSFNASLRASVLFFLQYNFDLLSSNLCSSTWFL